MLFLLLSGCSADIRAGLSTANELMFAQKYVEAERLYRKLLKKLDNSGELDQEERFLVLDRLGKINALYLRSYTQAISDFRSLVQSRPKSEQGFAALSTIADLQHYKLGTLDSAIVTYQQLINDYPNNPASRRAQLQIATAYFQLKNYEQARLEAEALINRWPQSPESTQAHMQIANSYYMQGRYEEAIATFDEILQNSTDAVLAALVMFELGNCYQELGDHERALGYYYACLPHHPNPTLVQRKIRRVRTRLHNIKPAAEILGTRRPATSRRN